MSFIQWKDFPEPLITNVSRCGPYSARIQGKDSAFSGQCDSFNPSRPYSNTTQLVACHCGLGPEGYKRVKSCHF